MLTKQTWTINNHELSFLEDKDTGLHQYLLDGKEVISTTQLLTKMGLCNEVSEKVRNSEKFQNAIYYGNKMHDMIATFIEEGTLPNGKMLPEDFIFFLKKVFPMCEEWHAEVPVFSKDGYAGRVDLWGLTKEKSLVIVDHKTGTSWTEDLVGWQMVLYYKGLVENNQVPEHKSVQFYCDDLKGSESALRPILVPDEKNINALLTAHKEGTAYTPIVPSVNEALLLDTVSVEELYLAGRIAEMLQDYVAEQEKILKEGMIAKGISKVRTIGDGVNFGLVSVGGSMTFDSSKFKEENPDLYKKYCIKPRKGYTYLNIRYSHNFEQRALERFQNEVLPAFPVKHIKEA